ncbi:hypothetical protein BC835DRAFT_578409 [Cytidiella melzeri]|nr:hypothetical protein BC835DRAFT_578409 [Cytidiella melzeri]
MSQPPSKPDSQSPQNENGRPLDESLYAPTEEEDAFFSSQTGIKDAEERKQHILAVQAEAYKVHPYNCIRAFAFARLKISLFPWYKDLLRLGRERPGALFLDLGCCTGHDLRKAVADGFPVNQAIGADLHAEFWDIGHKLFKTTPETFPAAFITADVFDPTSLAPAPIPTSVPTSPLPMPLNSLTSLNPLHARLSVIHTSSLFHLFSEEKQLELAKLVAPLLSPETGSFIFGVHGGLEVKGERQRKNSHGIHMFCHSPESWKELWETQVFAEGQVEVQAFLMDRRRFGRVLRDLPERAQVSMLVWCVKRL